MLGCSYIWFIIYQQQSLVQTAISFAAAVKISAGKCLCNDLYCVEWDVKRYLSACINWHIEKFGHTDYVTDDQLIEIQLSIHQLRKFVVRR